MSPNEAFRSSEQYVPTTDLLSTPLPLWLVLPVSPNSIGFLQWERGTLYYPSLLLLTPTNSQGLFTIF